MAAAAVAALAVARGTANRVNHIGYAAVPVTLEVMTERLTRVGRNGLGDCTVIDSATTTASSATTSLQKRNGQIRKG